METQKQMGAGQGEQGQQRQQGANAAGAPRREGEAERVQREGSAPATTQFNDWASI